MKALHKHLGEVAEVYLVLVGKPLGSRVESPWEDVCRVCEVIWGIFDGG